MLRAAAQRRTAPAALLAAGVEKGDKLAYLTLCDADAARQCAAAGVGQTLALSLGHKVSRLGDPISVSGRVVSLSDGSFVMLDAGARGTRVEFGLTAVVAVGSLRIAVRSLPSYEWDTGIYTAFGLRLEEASLVFVKSPSHFRVAFAPHAERVLLADTPGPTCPNMRRLQFRRVTRPLFPLDEDAPPNGLQSGSPAH
jgi:microcystin degradation protein MlrC